MLYSELLSRANKNYQEGVPFVIFRKSNSQQVYFWEQNNDDLYFFDENKKENGFILAPFEDKKSIFLKPEKMFSSICYEKENLPIKNIENFANQEDKNKYCKKIEKVIQHIKSTKTQKIVFSRCIDIDLQLINIGDFFHQMNCQYPTAFCYIFHHPKVGTWGASTPETLLKIEGNQLQTMALAGTQPYSENVIWTQKEIDEQQIVTNTITKQLKNYVEDINLSETQTVKAGNIVHLCTKIEAKIHPNEPIFQMVKKLHPTPAVCGFPTQEAKLYILNNEGYDREYYSGYCGTIFYNNNFLTLDLFVNLRCVQLFKNKARLYVGGGITKDSNPESEWQETENKSLTIKNIILNINK